MNTQISNPKINNSTIRDIANAVNSAGTIGGDGTFSTRGPQGTLISNGVNLKPLQQHNLPTLWSFKTGPGQKFVHLDRYGRRYPGLYVYLGANANMAMQAVQLQNPWIADGVHPSFFSFGDFRDYTPAEGEEEDEDAITTYLMPSDGDYSDPSKLTEFDTSWTTAESIKKAFIDTATWKSLDGWYELPVAAYAVTSLYAVAYCGPGLVPTLGFFNIDSRPGGLPPTNPTEMNKALQVQEFPDFSRFHQAAEINKDCFHGIIGSPKLMIGDNPYTEEAEQFWGLDFSKDPPEVVEPDENLVWNLYSCNTSMEFVDVKDRNEYAFRPVLLGSISGEGVALENEQWQYAFCLEFQPKNWGMPAEVPGDTQYKDTTEGEIEGDPVTITTSQKQFFVRTISATEGTVYQCRYIHQTGYGNTFNLIDPFDATLTALGLERTCTIAWDENKATPWTNKGEEIALLVKPKYDAESLTGIKTSDLISLVLTPLILDNNQTNLNAGIGGTLAYYPMVYRGHLVSQPPAQTATKLPQFRYINACSILGDTWNVVNHAVGAYENTTYGTGPWVVNPGETTTRKIGKLCPLYTNTSLEALCLPPMGDSWYLVQPSQYVTSSFDADMGSYFGQHGSIDLQTVGYGPVETSYYSLYQFAMGPQRDMIRYFNDEHGDPLVEGDNWWETGNQPKGTVDIVARVENTNENGEVPGAVKPGYHLEYIDATKLLADFWVRGADHTVNHGTSIAIGSTSGSQVIISVE